MGFRRLNRRGRRTLQSVVDARRSRPGTATSIDGPLGRRARLVLKRLTIAGLDMPYLEGGRGEALVLVHGFGGDKDNFTRLAGFLTCKYRVIIPDLPGFGDVAASSL